MLWPEEFAKLGDLVKNDLIGFVKGTLDRRRDPAELIISKIIPLERGPAELSRGVVVTLRKGVTEDEQLETPAPAGPASSPGTSTSTWRSRPGRRPPGDLPGRRVAADPLRRPARSPTSRTGRRRGQRPALSATGATARVEPVAAAAAQSRPPSLDDVDSAAATTTILIGPFRGIRTARRTCPARRFIETSRPILQFFTAPAGIGRIITPDDESETARTTSHRAIRWHESSRIIFD